MRARAEKRAGARPAVAAAELAGGACRLRLRLAGRMTRAAAGWASTAPGVTGVHIRPAELLPAPRVVLSVTVSFAEGERELAFRSLFDLANETEPAVAEWVRKRLSEDFELALKAVRSARPGSGAPAAAGEGGGPCPK